MIATVAELDRHGFAYRMRGFPVFGELDPDTDEREVVGTVSVPAVPLDAVKDEAAVELGRRYLAFLNERDEKRPDDAWLTDARCYAIVMEQNGVECYHPPHWRHATYQGSRLPIGGFWCEACDVVFIPHAA